MDNLYTFANNLISLYSIISMIFTTYFLVAFVRNIRSGSQATPDNYLFVKVIDNNGTLTMHDILTSQFICQGNTKEELWEIAQAAKPNITFIELIGEIIENKI